MQLAVALSNLHRVINQTIDNECHAFKGIDADGGVGPGLSCSDKNFWWPKQVPPEL